MPDSISRTVVLTGSLKGQTTTLRGLYPFVDGEMTITGIPEDVQREVQNLERNFNVVLKGHEPKEKEDGERDLHTGSGKSNGPSDVQSNLQSDGAGAGAATANNGSSAAAGHSGSAGVLPSGDGQQALLKVSEGDEAKTKGDGKAVKNDKLKRAIESLDPKDDSNWIASGKPALAAVEKVYGSSGVTRADVDAAAPGFVRPTK